MNTNQAPPTRSPQETIMKTPRPISRYEKTCPMPAAILVARLRSPVRHQAIARAMRPPSSGKAGIRLKTSTSRLIEAR